MKLKKQMMTMILAGGLASNAVLASDDEHFEGKKPASFAEAQAFMAEYNAKLAAIVEDGKVTPAEMGEVHQLTYTLENSLERMEEEMERIEEVLEEVHQGSEHGEYEAVLKQARQYLQDSSVLLGK
ncbi:DUF6746 family protein [Hydrogenovibrio halophilus]|uniref:DUF6746 family protein n=1 Tax=Hydrogenovibrio halophilus TaxID=373391 RepID=UPI00037F084A|nr:DUF6746 family protein [Hydrogenovibrio halophilus]